MYLSNMNYSRELRQKTELQKEFEKMLASQLDSLIINWNSTLTCIAETDYDKIKFKDEYKKLTKTLQVLYFFIFVTYLKCFIVSNFCYYFLN